MSGSPTYNFAALAKQQEEHLRAERRRLAQAAEAKRAAEAERQRAQQLLAAKQSVSRQIDAFLPRLAGISGSPRLLDEVAHIRKELERCQASVQRGSWDGEVWPFRDAVRRLELRLTTAIDSAAATERAARAAAEAQVESARTLAQARGIFDEILVLPALRDITNSRRRDPQGQAELSRLRDGFQRACGSADAALALEAAERMRIRAMQHQAAVDQASAAAEAWASALRSSAQELATRCALLHRDGMVGRWCQDRLVQTAACLNGLGTLIDAEDFPAAERALAGIPEELAAICRDAEDIQLQEDRRSYVVQSLMSALAESGFSVPDGGDLERPEEPRSAIILQARRLTGEALAISVPQDLGERIEYDLAGFPHHETVRADGTPATHCDEAETELERMRQVLGRLGVDCSPADWDTRDPDRLLHDARQLPTGSGRSEDGRS